MKTFILVRRDTMEIVSSKKFDSFDDARIERHKMEIANPNVIIDIFTNIDFQVGNKVKFNEKTKKKFRTWLKRIDNCGRKKFCEVLKQFDIDGYFTVIAEGIGNDPMRITLAEMPDWYFHSNDFVREV